MIDWHGEEQEQQLFVILINLRECFFLSEILDTFNRYSSSKTNPPTNILLNVDYRESMRSKERNSQRLVRSHSDRERNGEIEEIHRKSITEKGQWEKRIPECRQTERRSNGTLSQSRRHKGLFVRRLSVSVNVESLGRLMWGDVWSNQC
jgi:hypothetical protein